MSPQTSSSVFSLVYITKMCTFSSNTTLYRSLLLFALTTKKRKMRVLRTLDVSYTFSLIMNYLNGMISS